MTALLEYDLIIAQIKVGAIVYKPSEWVERGTIYSVDYKPQFYESPLEKYFVVHPANVLELLKECEAVGIQTILLSRFFEAEKEAFLNGREHPFT